MRTFKICCAMMAFSMAASWIRFSVPYAILLTASCVIGFMMRSSIECSRDKEESTDEEEE